MPLRLTHPQEGKQEQKFGRLSKKGGSLSGATVWKCRKAIKSHKQGSDITERNKRKKFKDEKPEGQECLQEDIRNFAEHVELFAKDLCIPLSCLTFLYYS